MILASAFHQGFITAMKMEISQTTPTAERNLQDANKAAVLRLYDECLNQGKFEAADCLISSRFIVPGPEGGTGPEGFKANTARLRAGFPDVHFTIHDLIAEDERVAVYWAWEGTHRGTFANIPATGKRVQQEGMVMYRFAAGKVISARLIFDRLGVFQQLGVLPALPTNANSAKPATA